MGGMGAGTVELPEHIVKYHKTLLDSAWSYTAATDPSERLPAGKTLTDLLQYGVGRSPYSGAAAYNPSQQLATIEGAVDDLGSELVSDWDPLGQTASVGTPHLRWVDAIETALTKSTDVIGTETTVSLTKPKLDPISLAGASVAPSTIEDPSFKGTLPDISDAVDSYATRADPQVLRTIGRFAAGMADINAVMGSAFVIGLGLIDAEAKRDYYQTHAGLTLSRDQLGYGKDVRLMELIHQKNLQAHSVDHDANKTDALIEAQRDDREATLSLERDFRQNALVLDQEFKQSSMELNREQTYNRTVSMFVLQASNQMSSLIGQRANARQAFTSMVSEANKIGIVALNDYNQLDVAYDVEDAKWDISMLQDGASVFASPSGFPVVSRPVPRWASALIGAAAGLATAGSIGVLTGSLELGLIAGGLLVPTLAAAGWATGG